MDEIQKLYEQLELTCKATPFTYNAHNNCWERVENDLYFSVENSFFLRDVERYMRRYGIENTEENMAQAIEECRWL